ncbi:MAG: phosphoribosyltransferase [Epsilonproteobacteria bacterium]|nr:phosphoribosyltransferase [Campylobacterota bacterium]NPA56965.1 phosphoribosyltransferase [Campylobacterota bacterium]
MVFSDRFEAGKVLAELLQEYRGNPNTVVIALPRGGVPVGYMIARELKLPLDIFFVKKIPSPYNPEAAIGAVSEDGREYLNQRAVAMLNISRPYIEEQVAQITDNMRKKRALYQKPRIPIQGKRVILVDDGVATGASIYLAAQALRDGGAREIIIAVPVAPPDALPLLREVADRVVIPHIARDFMAVGQYYRDFHQLGDDEVIDLLNSPTME